MITIKELISYWKSKLDDHPPISALPWPDVVEQTILYLNAYSQLRTMLKDLAKDAIDLEAEGSLQ